MSNITNKDVRDFLTGLRNDIKEHGAEAAISKLGKSSDFNCKGIAWVAIHEIGKESIAEGGFTSDVWKDIAKKIEAATGGDTVNLSNVRNCAAALWVLGHASDGERAENAFFKLSAAQLNEIKGSCNVLSVRADTARKHPGDPAHIANRVVDAVAKNSKDHLADVMSEIACETTHGCSAAEHAQNVADSLHAGYVKVQRVANAIDHASGVTKGGAPTPEKNTGKVKVKPVVNSGSSRNPAPSCPECGSDQITLRATFNWNEHKWDIKEWDDEAHCDHCGVAVALKKPFLP